MPSQATQFKPGQSGNPKGRPPTGLALAERIRQKVEPDELIRIALAIARDEEARESDRMTAVNFLAERGWAKPPQQLLIEATGSKASYNISALPMAEQSTLLAALSRTRHLPPGDDDGGGQSG